MNINVGEKHNQIILPPPEYMTMNDSNKIVQSPGLTPSADLNLVNN